MKSRKYVYSDREDFVEHLDALLQSGVSPASYKAAMYELGKDLSEGLLRKIESSDSFCLASTAEDADFLSKGIIDSISGTVADIKLACFWNYHSTPIKGQQSTAPIIRKFVENGFKECKHLIITKSVISGSCVVKTNLTDLIEIMRPEKIYVVAPVMHVDAEKKLKMEFPETISSKFIFETLVYDDEKSNETSEVILGIGGDVYRLLGFKSQEDKNTFTPELVMQKMFA